MKVLIDGLNFELAHGTGIKTFARSAMTALASSGHELGLLSEQNIRQVQFVSPIDGYLAGLTASGNKKRSLTTKLLTAYRLLNQRLKTDILIEDRDLLASISGCNQWHDLDSIRIRPSLFTKAFVRSSLGLGMQPIHDCKDIDALFLTSPIPVYLPDRLNVLTIHDLIPLSHPRLIDRWEVIAKAFGSTLHDGLKRADKVICMSETSKNEILKRFAVNESKLQVIYQPCRYATERTSFDQEQRANILASMNLRDEPFVLFVGAIEPKKNLLNVLKAVAQNPTIPKLVIVGPFAWSSNQEQAIIQQMKDRVVHLGFVSDIELQALQQSALACVFPSIVEGFGLPALEAIWNGSPCVLSDIPVFRELFADNQYFVNPHNPGEIGAAILQACNADTQYRQALSSYVKERYSMQQFEASLKKVFNKS